MGGFVSKLGVEETRPLRKWCGSPELLSLSQRALRTDRDTHNCDRRSCQPRSHTSAAVFPRALEVESDHSSCCCLRKLLRTCKDCPRPPSSITAQGWGRHTEKGSPPRRTQDALYLRPISLCDLGRISFSLEGKISSATLSFRADWNLNIPLPAWMASPHPFLPPIVPSPGKPSDRDLEEGRRCCWRSSSLWTYGPM